MTGFYDNLYAMSNIEKKHIDIKCSIIENIKEDRSVGFTIKNEIPISCSLYFDTNENLTIVYVTFRGYKKNKLINEVYCKYYFEYLEESIPQIIKYSENKIKRSKNYKYKLVSNDKYYIYYGKNNKILWKDVDKPIIDPKVIINTFNSMKEYLSPYGFLVESDEEEGDREDIPYD